jgi:hypothetical protein
MDGTVTPGGSITVTAFFNLCFISAAQKICETNKQH